jgi:hypothetical protein
MTKASRVLPLALALCVCALAPHRAWAQGRGHGSAAPSVPPGRARQVVTVDHAATVTREVLVAHGYEVVRIEEKKGMRIVYFRRGNMGNGRGKGPVQRLVIRPATETVVFEDAPPKVLVDIRVKLAL